MASVEIWVPILGTGTRDDGYRPDLPCEGTPPAHTYLIDWTTDEGAPTDFGDPKCPPACEYFNVIVDEKDVPKCTERIADADVPEGDKLLVAMIRKTRRDAYFVRDGSDVPSEPREHNWPSRSVKNGKVYFRLSPATNVALNSESDIAAADAAGTLGKLCGGIEERADEFFDSIPNVTTGSSARKTMVKKVLIHAVHFGLSAEKAEAIRLRLNLPEADKHGL